MPQPPEPLTLPVVVPSGPMTRSLREQVQGAIADLIPLDKRGAAVAIAGHEGATLTVATRIGESWALGGDVTRKWGGDVHGRVLVVGTW